MGFLEAVFLLLGMVLAGFAFGLLQWLVLLWRVPHASRWVPSTILGVLAGAVTVGLAYGLGAMVVMGSGLDKVKDKDPRIGIPIEVASLGILLLGGGVLGLVQSVALRLDSRRAVSWTTASAFGALSFWLVDFLVLNWQKPWGSDPSPPPIFATPLSGAAGGLAYGAISGLALVWLLRRRTGADGSQIG